MLDSAPLATSHKQFTGLFARQSVYHSYKRGPSQTCFDPYGNYTNKKRETTITDDNNTKYIVNQSLKAVKELIEKAKQSPDDAESVLVDNLIKIV